MNLILPGKIFNLKYKNKNFVKLTNETENRNGYQFKNGLNVDCVPFNPTENCKSGGIYFCQIEDLHKWLYYDNSPMFYVRSVIIPDDSLIYIERNKFKTDQLILGEKKPIADLDIWHNIEFCLSSIRQDYRTLQYISKQTDSIKLMACKLNGYALMYIPEQTLEIKLAAVKNNGFSIGLIKDQTLEICLAAVKNNGLSLEFVIDQTEEIIFAAINNNWKALEYVKKQTYEIKLAAVKKEGMALKYINCQPYEICFEAIKNNSNALRYVSDEKNHATLLSIIQLNEKELNKRYNEENNCKNECQMCQIL